MNAVERKFALQVPSSTANLALIRDFVTGIGRQAGLDDGESAKLELAVDEACANVIEHAYGRDMSKEVTVRVSYTDEAVQVAVIDTGVGFDPGSVESAEVERLIAERKSGGLGLRLIRSLMDEVRYDLVPGLKNELHMVKKIPRP